MLVHWNAAEAAARAARLARTGHEVEIYSQHGGEGLRDYREDPPGAFVIDLERLPSHGRAVATFLRQQKATRGVPIVFVGGESGKLAKARELLPDAVYTDWGKIRGSLRDALRKPPSKPIVPGTMQGYSGTPLLEKLAIRAGDMLALLGGPVGFTKTLGPLPEGVRVRAQARQGANVILLFARSRGDLAGRFPGAAKALAERGRLWIVWPKKASGVQSDLGEAAVRAFGLDAGFVDYKICAVDETWSGLLFARRSPKRSP